MDIDGYIAAHQASWQRLDHLASTAQSGVRKLSASELDELILLYQRVSGHLSLVRTQYREPDVIAELTRILARARGVIYRPRTNPAAALGRFASQTFPAAVWAIRRTILVSGIIFLLPALVVGVWLTHDGAARESAIPAETARLIAERDFAEYYRSDAAANFQTNVTTNNVRVSLVSFAGGVLLGIPTIAMLAYNGFHVGQVAAVMHAYGQGAQFWGLVTPHGLLEITSLVIAGAAGLRLAWAVVSPGDRRRGEVLAEEGLRSISIALGLVVTFAIAGFVEAWVTPSSLPTAARVGIGVLLEVAFVLYVVAFGRSAASRGATGRFGEELERLDA
jgi:uncharacterized membrane protein SpoIIM required for sporulation